MAANLSRELDSLMQKLDALGSTPTLLLHCCCAPCSSSVLERLTSRFKVTVFFCNPNIYPSSEYDYRLAELRRLINAMPAVNPVSILECEYHPEQFFDAVKGLECEKEGGARCRVCFELRLKAAAKAASEGNFDYFTTTLSLSPLKNAALLYDIACEQGEKYSVNALPSDFKKKDGFKRSLELSREYGLYRQNYCGCVFSQRNSLDNDSEKL